MRSAATTPRVAVHHFSNEYGIIPDVFDYAADLAARTKHI